MRYILITLYVVIVFTACNSPSSVGPGIKSFDSFVTNTVTTDDRTITFPTKAEIVSVETVQSGDLFLGDEYFVIVKMYNHRYLYHFWFAGNVSRESAVMLQ